MTNMVAQKPAINTGNNAYEFTLNDRCDRCGAGAYVRAIRFDLDSPLLFCAHHAAKDDNIAVLERQGFIIDDGRKALYQGTPGASA